MATGSGFGSSTVRPGAFLAVGSKLHVCLVPESLLQSDHAFNLKTYEVDANKFGNVTVDIFPLTDVMIVFVTGSHIS